MLALARRRLVFAAMLVLLILAGLWLFWRPSIAIAPSLHLPPVDRLVVNKAKRQMLAYSGGRLVHTFEGIQLGDAPVGQKQFEGDERTPEGRYSIDYRNPRSRYHLSLHISYPDKAARDFARQAGRSPGGDVFIHGQPNSLPLGRMRGDWTNGCIALSNDEIEALWLAVEDGTQIEIRP